MFPSSALKCVTDTGAQTDPARTCCLCLQTWEVQSRDVPGFLCGTKHTLGGGLRSIRKAELSLWGGCGAVVQGRDEFSKHHRFLITLGKCQASVTSLNHTLLCTIHSMKKGVSGVFSSVFLFGAGPAKKKKKLCPGV